MGRGDPTGRDDGAGQPEWWRTISNASSPAVEEMPVEGPFIVQDSPAIKPLVSPTSDRDPDAPKRPVEAARTRDGEIDPPHAAG